MFGFFSLLLLLLGIVSMLFVKAHSLLRQQLGLKQVTSAEWAGGNIIQTAGYWVHLTKASCWAGNVEELPKHPGPISSLLFNGFTPIPYDGVYCSTHTPLPPPLSFKHTSRSRGKEGERECTWEEAMGKNKHKSKRATRITLYRALRKIVSAKERVNKPERKTVMN